MKSLFPIACVALLAACNAETNFQNTNEGGDYETGNGGLQWSPEALEISGLQPGITQSATLQLLSVGDNNLHIDEVRIVDSGGGVFYIGDDDEYDDRVLQPGDSLEVPVMATMDEWAAEAVGSIRIKCNDPEYAPSMELPVTAYPSADWGAPEDTGDTGP